MSYFCTVTGIFNFFDLPNSFHSSDMCAAARRGGTISARRDAIL
jgi:hypothetical protein